MPYGVMPQSASAYTFTAKSPRYATVTSSADGTGFVRYPPGTSNVSIYSPRATAMNVSATPVE